MSTRSFASAHNKRSKYLLNAATVALVVFSGCASKDCKCALRLHQRKHSLWHSEHQRIVFKQQDKLRCMSRSLLTFSSIIHHCSPSSLPPLPRTISRHFQHGALAPLSSGCNTNAAPPPASPLPSAAHEALRRAGGQGGVGFISENKRNVKRGRVRRRGDVQRDCEAGDAS